MTFSTNKYSGLKFPQEKVLIESYEIFGIDVSDLDRLCEILEVCDNDDLSKEDIEHLNETLIFVMKIGLTTPFRKLLRLDMFLRGHEIDCWLKNFIKQHRN